MNNHNVKVFTAISVKSLESDMNDWFSGRDFEVVDIHYNFNDLKVEAILIYKW